jgi:glycosyltransferase involved in cell wall biosynthesis
MISVVIPTYNEEKNIEMTLKKMTRQTLPRKDYEIIVVDGDSTDNTRKIARKYMLMYLSLRVGWKELLIILMTKM